MIASKERYRNDESLNHLMENLWGQHFPDVERINPINIGFGKPWKTRLGMIRLGLQTGTSYIEVNRLLTHPSAPEEIIIVTVGHELCHYAQGFGSSLPRINSHPHKNGVIDDELNSRGFGRYLKDYKAWLNDWEDFYERTKTLLVKL